MYRDDEDTVDYMEERMNDALPRTSLYVNEDGFLVQDPRLAEAADESLHPHPWEAGFYE